MTEDDGTYKDYNSENSDVSRASFNNLDNAQHMLLQWQSKLKHMRCKQLKDSIFK